MSTAAAIWWAWTAPLTMSGNRSGGFTYLAVLAMITAAGITLAGTGQYWRTTVIREREAELLWRGHHFRLAIDSYLKATPEGRPREYPKRLEDLLKDPRSLQPVRHIRKIYPDPMTPEGEWGILRTENGGIRGIFSRAEGKPFKTAGFPPEYAHFETAETYSDWKFVSKAPAPQPTKEGESQ